MMPEPCCGRALEASRGLSRLGRHLIFDHDLGWSASLAATFDWVEQGYLCLIDEPDGERWGLWVQDPLE